MSGVYEAGATTARLDDAIAIAPPHFRPILLAVRDFRAGLLIVSQGQTPFAVPYKPARPAILLIGDDLVCSMGPAGFHEESLRAAIASSDAFVIVAGAPLPELYAVGSAVAVGGKRGMIIETQPQQVAAWASLIDKLAKGRPVLVSVPKAGEA